MQSLVTRNVVNNAGCCMRGERNLLDGRDELSLRRGEESRSPCAACPLESITVLSRLTGQPT
jgi:hypothetical protein